MPKNIEQRDVGYDYSPGEPMNGGKPMSALVADRVIKLAEIPAEYRLAVMGLCDMAQEGDHMAAQGFALELCRIARNKELDVREREDGFLAAADRGPITAAQHNAFPKGRW